MNDKNVADDGRSGDRKRSHLALLWRLGVSIGLLTLLAVVYVDFDMVGEVVLHASPVLILVTILVLLLGRVVYVYRWKQLIAHGDHSVSFHDLFRMVMVSSFLGFFVPGSLGIEAVRIYALAKRSELSLAVSSVLVERVAAVFALTGLVLLGMFLSPIALPHAVELSTQVAMAGLVITIVALFHPPSRAIAFGLTERLLPTTLAGKLRGVAGHLNNYRGRPRLLVSMLLLSILMQLLRIVEGILLAEALDIDVAWSYMLILIPVSVIVTMIPVTFFGLGVREVTFVGLLGLVGISAEAAFAMSILNFALAILAVNLPGAFYYFYGGIVPAHRQSTTSPRPLQ